MACEGRVQHFVAALPDDVGGHRTTKKPCPIDSSSIHSFTITRMTERRRIARRNANQAIVSQSKRRGSPPS